MSVWEIEPHSKADKHFTVTGPGDFRMYVDYDDVNHEEIDATAEEMVRVLNNHEWWPYRP